jgi:hypothetical protein
VTLYRPESFEPLTDAAWDEDAVRAGIREIVADTDAALRGPKLLWQADSWDNWHATSPLKNLYVGAAGVLWALDELRRRGYAESKLDLPDLALRNLELFRAKPDFIKVLTLPEPKESALMTGEAGILLVAWRLAPSGELADDLLARVRANVDNEAQEVMWGSPGPGRAPRALPGGRRVAGLSSGPARAGRSAAGRALAPAARGGRGRVPARRRRPGRGRGSRSSRPARR